MSAISNSSFDFDKIDYTPTPSIAADSESGDDFNDLGDHTPIRSVAASQAFCNAMSIKSMSPLSSKFEVKTVGNQSNITIWPNADTALAVVSYKFATFHTEDRAHECISFDRRPRQWQFAPRPWEDIIQISKEKDCAAKLIALIVFFTMLDPFEKPMSTSWKSLIQYAGGSLFNLAGAPSQYLVKLQGFNLEKKGILNDVPFEKGEAYCVINRLNPNGEILFTWINKVSGDFMSRKVIGSLPEFPVSVL